MDNIDHYHEDKIDYDMNYEDNNESDMDYEDHVEDDMDYKTVHSSHFRDNFANWTSGNMNLDELIQNSQLNATHPWKSIEWIEYSNLENIELIAQGGFGSIYKAIWKDGPTRYWDYEKSKWERSNCAEVVVKKFRNATHVSLSFLNEINITNRLSNIINEQEIIRIYGATLDPQSDEYAIVTPFKNGGNLRELIKKTHNKLTWKIIIEMFRIFSWTLSRVHQENYYHKDLHSGNILYEIDDDNIFLPTISDFGLCRPMDQSSTDKVLYGVLPFVAPEVLRGGEFTEAADIYGFGMIMFEAISGEPPFTDREYDAELALAICNGLRPQIPKYTPEPYAELMRQCLDPIPVKRPTANELGDQFSYILTALEFTDDELGDDESNELISDEESNELISDEESNEFNENESIKFSEDDLSELNKFLKIMEAFNQERENKWKARLAELVTNPTPPKKSQNLFTSKQLDYSQSDLSQKLTVEDWNKLEIR
ncbi:hypothetical protein RclHR1_07560005 [Rhizophagus clarus]|uniref:Protein kinase domain-containing protein n=1 Tax=Rhizophagus clarus TaxID=94130 RepID=A0A2Z6RZ96_9GLOM|nr:hypothetical protein RclHR1_07560005 [Rhizophagus clarus]